MNSIFILILAMATFAATAGDLKSGGQYESQLRNVGIPISSGLTFPTK